MHNKSEGQSTGQTNGGLLGSLFMKKNEEKPVKAKVSGASKNATTNDRKTAKEKVLFNRRGLDDGDGSDSEYEESIEMKEMAVETSADRAYIAKRKELINSKLEVIKQIQDPAMRDIMNSLAQEILNLVDEGQKKDLKINDISRNQKQLIEHANETQKSVNNLSTGVGRLGNELSSIDNRLQTVETTTGCQTDRQFLHINFIDSHEADEVESGVIWPKNKCLNILDAMNIKFNKFDICDVSLQSARRRFGDSTRTVKFLKVKFNGTTWAGKILTQIIKANNKLKNEQGDIKYIAEIPNCRNVWKLKRICLELKKDGIISNVHVNDNGLAVVYKYGEENKKYTVTNLSDIDRLRKLLQVEDQHIPVSVKYSESFWKAKFERNHAKRSRSELNESKNDDDDVRSRKSQRSGSDQ